MTFASDFENLTGNPPFPWQQALYRRFVGIEPGDIPSSCNLPTGLGKTSVVAVWLLALAEKPESVPRRLVYVVNRRTVVDQTTNEVETYRESLVSKIELASIRSTLEGLGALPLAPHQSPLALSTLRGQFADNREWSADPARPAVIVGTVEMIGSRLLFSGYGVGRNAKPLHAGFLGQDTLIVHDEAHLEPAFQELLIAILDEQTEGRFPPDFCPLRVMELSATSRLGSEDEPFALTSDEKVASKESPGVLGIVGSRIHAAKHIHLHEQTDAKPGVQLAKLAIETFKESDKAILIFTRTIDDVRAITDALDKEKQQTVLLIGPIRGRERERLTNPFDPDGSPIFARFLPPQKPNVPESDRWKVLPAEGTVYLVCTSAGEVGVNISADHLVCDLSTFESMAQRFGRVNRFGKCDDTRIDVVHPTVFGKKDKNGKTTKDQLDLAMEKTLALLNQLDGNASPHALSQLDAKARAEAFAPTPQILPATDILFDAWSMTSITGKLPGRPKVEPYLHGISAWEPPQTQVAWREEVGLITPDMFADYPPSEMLEAYPLKAHELLTDRSDRVWKELCELAKQFGDHPVWIVDTDGTVDSSRNLYALTEWDKKQAESELKDQVVLLPHNIGGLTTQGLLDGKYPPAPKADDEVKKVDNDVADQWSDIIGSMRSRVWSTPDKASPDTPAGMKLVLRIDFIDRESDEELIQKSWYWFVRIAAADADARSRQHYDLEPHLRDAHDTATAIVEKLSLDPEISQAVLLAAKFHDIGKDRERWQRSIGNRDYPNHKWAKSGKRTGKPERFAYRHEFGSLLDVQTQPEFGQLSQDTKDLVLHLIAAHHGRARPHFTQEECIDENHSNEVQRNASMEVVQRFARLQRRYGRWGLAYLESLVRAADWAASAKADQSATGRKS